MLSNLVPIISFSFEIKEVARSWAYLLKIFEILLIFRHGGMSKKFGVPVVNWWHNLSKRGQILPTT